MRLRELQVTYKRVAGSPEGPRPQVTTATDAAAVISPLLAGKTVEHFGVLSVDTKRRVIGWDVVSVGTLDAALVHPREVFVAAILHHASAIVVAHNHPSGDPSPSIDDVQMAERLKRCGEILGIQVLDALVVGDEGQFTSLRDQGRF